MKRPKRTRLTLMDRFSIAICDSNIGEVEVDNEEKWINLRIKDNDIYIQFSDKGDKIEGIKAFKDVIEVTGQQRIF